MDHPKTGPLSIFYTISLLFEKRPLISSISCALFLRTIAAILNYGPAEIDDHKNIIAPALKFLQTGSHPEVPLLRFPIFPYLFSAFMYPVHFLGVKNPRYLVSFGYFIMAILSLLQVWGMYKLGGLYLNKQKRNILTFLSAVYFLSPFFSTRMYLGSFAIISITWAFYFLGKSVLKTEINPLKTRYIYLAGLLFSLTIFFRFTLTPLYFCGLFYLIYKNKKEYPQIFFYLFGGITTILLMICIEIAADRIPFSTSINFLRHNFDSHILHNAYGEMPWYSYLGLIFSLFIFPISLILFWPFLIGGFRLRFIFSCFLLIFLLHQAIDHKLERFLIPLLPLFFLLTVYGLQILSQKRFVQNSFRVFMVLNLPLAFLAATNGSQMATINGLIGLRELDDEKHKIVMNVQTISWAYYGYDKTIPIRASSAKNIIQIVEKNLWKDFYLLKFLHLNEDDLSKLLSKNIQCHKKNVFEPSFLEKMVIRSNPDFNNRRRETILYQCIKSNS